MSVSVVIPYYNDSPVFERCLSSIADQTSKVDEVIVIDDCSEDSDSALDIIRRFSRLNVIYKRNEKNLNGAVSRNIGINIASSFYVALLDADDYWKESHVEECLKNIGTADFIFSNITEVSSDCFSFREKKVVDPATLYNKYDAILISPPQTGSFFFRKKVFNLVQFDEKLRRHQDYQFFIDALMCCECKYVDIYTTYYVSSHRPLRLRYDFESTLRFFDSKSELLTSDLLKKYIMRVIIGKLPYIDRCLSDYVDVYPFISFTRNFKLLIFASKIRNIWIKKSMKALSKIVYNRYR